MSLQHAHGTNNTFFGNDSNLLRPPPPRRWLYVMVTSMMVLVAAGLYQYAYIQREAARIATDLQHKAEKAGKEAEIKNQEALQALQKQVAEMAAKQTVVAAAKLDKPAKKSAAKPAMKLSNDTIITFKVEDDLEAPRGLIGICGVKDKDQAKFLNATYRLNFGDEIYTTAEELKKLNDVRAKNVWNFRADQCPNLANATTSE